MSDEKLFKRTKMTGADVLDAMERCQDPRVCLAIMWHFLKIKGEELAHGPIEGVAPRYVRHAVLALERARKEVDAALVFLGVPVEDDGTVRVEIMDEMLLDNPATMELRQ